MLLAKPRTIHWTFHSRAKMRRYGLSEARVRRILHTPGRIEEGIAPKTTAMMQRTGSAAHPSELWVMVEVVTPKRGGDSDRSVGNTIKVISAWRYPGVTKPKSAVALELMRSALDSYVRAALPEREVKKEETRKTLTKSKWFRPAKKKLSGPANLLK